MSWRSIRCASCSSVQMTCRPPSSRRPAPSRMSVPRPAMFVATVSLPGWPAAATISASRSTCRALSTVGVGAARGEQLGQLLALVDRSRADQHGPVLRKLRDRIVDDRVPLLLRRAEHERRQLLANRRAVRRNRLDVHLVDLPQLAAAGRRRAGHAAQPLVPQKQILHGDPRRLVRRERDLDAFLRLDRLVNAGPPLPPLGQPAREFVDDHDLAVANHVVPIEEHLARRP